MTLDPGKPPRSSSISPTSSPRSASSSASSSSARRRPPAAATRSPRWAWRSPSSPPSSCPACTNILWIIDRPRRRRQCSAIYPARTVKMTAMPQMVAIFNGMGGATAALVSLVEFEHKFGDRPRRSDLRSCLGVIIGSISFSGSMIAFAKLQELMPGRPDLLPVPAPDQRRHRHRRDRRWLSPSSSSARPGSTQLLIVILFLAALVARRADRAADRWRGHAGRHRRPQLDDRAWRRR